MPERVAIERLGRRLGEERIFSTRATASSSTLPAAAVRPSSSRGCPVRMRTKSSISALPGPALGDGGRTADEKHQDALATLTAMQQAAAVAHATKCLPADASRLARRRRAVRAIRALMRNLAQRLSAGQHRERPARSAWSADALETSRPCALSRRANAQRICRSPFPPPPACPRPLTGGVLGLRESDKGGYGWAPHLTGTTGSWPRTIADGAAAALRPRSACARS